MPHKESEDDPKSLSITFDFLMMLLVFIIIFGLAIGYGIIKHSLCTRKGVSQTSNPSTSLDKELGSNPSFDLLSCKK
jgi:hypothetical protein